MEALRGFYRLHKEPRPRILHLYDMFDKDVKDDEWIPKVGGEDCIIITADCGKGKRPRLPELCKQYRRTHILISPTMHIKVSLFQKARAIVILWPQLLKTLQDEPGTCFQIRAIDEDHQRFSLVKKN